MLRDILNPFNQFVARGRRPSHPGTGASGDGTASRRVIVPVGRPPSSVKGGDSLASRHHAEDEPFATRIMIGPGPGEVETPKWWQNHEVDSGRPEISS
jgi:hypothetical protein